MAEEQMVGQPVVTAGVGVEHLRSLVSRYTDVAMGEYRLIDCSRDEGRDIRFIYIVELSDGGKIVIKVARSSFATSARVEAWGGLTYQYRNAGIYCPLFIRATESQLFCEALCVDGLAFVAWAEEHKAYRTLDEVMDELQAGGLSRDEAKQRLPRNWDAQVGRHLGQVCTRALNGPKPDFATVYVLYDTFSSDDACDENLENATSVYNTLRGCEHIGTAMVEDIWQTYRAKREQLEPLYRRLPRGMVQGDLSWNNVLVDDDLNFAGVIDFNLSGTETIIRYAMHEGMEHPLGELGTSWVDPGFISGCDDSLRTFLGAFQEHYTLSAEEAEAFGPIYNIVRPFTWPLVCGLLDHFRTGNYGEVNLRLAWMHRELNRTDMAAMLCQR